MSIKKDKCLSKIEKKAYNWLKREMGYKNIERMGWAGIPDFLCDSDYVEVKYVNSSGFYLTPKQKEVFENINPFILIMDKDKKPKEMIRYSECKKKYKMGLHGEGYVNSEIGV